jgi:hypothetical protein
VFDELHVFHYDIFQMIIHDALIVQLLPKSIKIFLF